MDRTDKFELEKLNNNYHDEGHEMLVLQPKGLGQRHVMIILIFFAMGISFGLRMVLSVAIVAMIDTTINPTFKHFLWDEGQRGIIFGCNFWGVLLSTSVAGIICQRYGAKIPLFISIFGMSVLAIATPFIAPMGWIYMCIRQVCEGAFGGFAIVTSHYLFGKWIHPIERTQLVPFAIVGIIVGKIVSLSVTGVIVSSALGWPGAFQIPGIVGLIWSAFWWIYGSNSPLTNSRISSDERAFLQTIPGITVNKISTPWKAILTSRPVWVLIFSQCCQNWCYVMLWVSMPTYFNAILHYDIKSSALLTALPYGIALLVSAITTPLSAWLIKKGHTSIPTSRKIFNTIGMWVPAFGLAWLGFVSNNVQLALCLLIGSVAFNGIITSGFSISHLDLSTNYSAILSSLITCIGASMSVITPMYYGFIVKNIYDPTLWRILFFTGASTFFVGNLVFMLLGDWSVQHWNELSTKKEAKNGA